MEAVTIKYMALALLLNLFKYIFIYLFTCLIMTTVVPGVLVSP